MPMLWWYKTSLARILALSHHPSLIRSHHQYVIWFQQKWFLTFNRKSSKINKTNIYDQWSITNSFLLDNGPMVCKQLCLKLEYYIMISQEIIHNKYILHIIQFLPMLWQSVMLLGISTHVGCLLSRVSMLQSAK